MALPNSCLERKQGDTLDLYRQHSFMISLHLRLISPEFGISFPGVRGIRHARGGHTEMYVKELAIFGSLQFVPRNIEKGNVERRTATITTTL